MELRKNEQPMVFWSFLLSVSVGFPRLFTMTLGNSLFLGTYPAAYLPLIYMGSALLNPIVGMGYLFLEKRLAFQRLQEVGVLFLTGVSFLFLILLYTTNNPGYVGIGLLIWLDIEWTLTSLILWGTTNRMYTLEQSKRLYGLVGSGEILVMVIGGILGGFMSLAFGVRSLLWFSFGGFLIMMPIVKKLFRLKPSELANPLNNNPAEKDYQPNKKSGYRFMLIIFFGLFQYGIYFFGDTLFYLQAGIRYPGAEDLAQFFSWYFPVLGILTLVFKIFLSGRILPVLGLGKSLLLTPLGLGLFGLGVGGAILGFGQGIWVFAVVVGLRLFQAVFFSGLVYPAFYSLLQPLEPRQRSITQTQSELIYGPLIGVIMGLGLFVLTGVLGIGTFGLGVFLILGAGVWFWFSRVLFARYKRALDEAVSAGIFSAQPYALDSQALKQVANSCLNEDSPLVKIKIGFLEAVSYSSIQEVYQKLLQHRSADIRCLGLVSLHKEFFENLENQEKFTLFQDPDALVLQTLVSRLCETGKVKCIDLPPSSLDPSWVKKILHFNDSLWEYRGISGELEISLQRDSELRNTASWFSQDFFISSCVRILKGEYVRESRSQWIQWLEEQCVRSGLLEPCLALLKSEENVQIQGKIIMLCGRVGGIRALQPLSRRAVEVEDPIRGMLLGLCSRLTIRTLGEEVFPEILSGRILNQLVSEIATARHGLSATPQENRNLLRAWEQRFSDLLSQVFWVLKMGKAGVIMDAMEKAYCSNLPDKQALVVERLELVLDPGTWNLVAPIFAYNVSVHNTIPIEKIILSNSWLYWLWTGSFADQTRADIAITLGNLFLFQGFSLEQRWQIARKVKTRTMAEGGEIITQGDTDTCLYVVVKGEAGVLRDGHEIAKLYPGAILGEFAALDDAPRSASVIMGIDSQVYELSREDLFAQIHENPSLVLSIMEVLVQKTKTEGCFGVLDEGIELTQSDPKDLFQRGNALARIPLFSRLLPEDQLFLAQSSEPFFRESGSSLWSQEWGESAVYLLFSGEVDFADQDKIKKITAPYVLGQGSIFLGGLEKPQSIVTQPVKGLYISRPVLEALTWSKPDILIELAYPYLVSLRQKR